mmetsp:Transcript_53422/g.141653  ORF Transcript_53422/g.141653 Transcript_53422/m.141653 type:complete len:311 (+) Transcript_53422:222-1154(+)
MCIAEWPAKNHGAHAHQTNEKSLPTSATTKRRRSLPPGAGPPISNTVEMQLDDESKALSTKIRQRRPPAQSTVSQMSRPCTKRPQNQNAVNNQNHISAIKRMAHPIENLHLVNKAASMLPTKKETRKNRQMCQQDPLGCGEHRRASRPEGAIRCLHLAIIYKSTLPSQTPPYGPQNTRFANCLLTDRLRCAGHWRPYGPSKCFEKGLFLLQILVLVFALFQWILIQLQNLLANVGRRTPTPGIEHTRRCIRIHSVGTCPGLMVEIGLSLVLRMFAVSTRAGHIRCRNAVTRHPVILSSLSHWAVLARSIA